MTFPFHSVLFKRNGYHFRAVENGEQHSMKQELNRKGTALATLAPFVLEAYACAE